jgi:hypothetical protein
MLSGSLGNLRTAHYHRCRCTDDHDQCCTCLSLASLFPAHLLEHISHSHGFGCISHVCLLSCVSLKTRTSAQLRPAATARVAHLALPTPHCSPGLAPRAFHSAIELTRSYLGLGDSKFWFPRSQWRHVPSQFGPDRTEEHPVSGDVVTHDWLPRHLDDRNNVFELPAQRTDTNGLDEPGERDKWLSKHLWPHRARLFAWEAHSLTGILVGLTACRPASLPSVAAWENKNSKPAKGRLVQMPSAVI